MRKVYHAESSSLGLIVSMICSVGLTVVLFGSLPFAHRIGKTKKIVDLRKVESGKLEDQTEELPEVEKPPEAEKPPEPLPAPDLNDSTSQALPQPSLDVFVGEGGGLKGFGDLSAGAAAQAVQDSGAFDVSDLEKRPEPISQVAPSYPPALLRAKIEGSVTLVFVLGEDGRVEDPRVEESSNPEFEKPALDAIRKWRFRPGMKDGQPVRTYIRAPIRFRLPTG